MIDYARRTSRLRTFILTLTAREQHQCTISKGKRLKASTVGDWVIDNAD